jgi:undecaprenyl-diphosphatase
MTSQSPAPIDPPGRRPRAVPRVVSRAVSRIAPRIAPRALPPLPPLTPRAAQLATIAAATGAFVALTLARRAHAGTLPIDRRVQALTRRVRLAEAPHAWARGRRSSARLLFDAVGGLTGQWPPALAGAAAALAVARRHGLGPALPVAAAVPASNALHALAKYSLGHRRPMLARLTGKRTPAFPSGHGARGAAAAGILAWVAAREDVAPLALGLPLGAALAVVGASQRVWVERHWATDILGGLAVGAAVAAGCARWFDAARDP